MAGLIGIRVQELARSGKDIGRIILFLVGAGLILFSDTTGVKSVPDYILKKQGGSRTRAICPADLAICPILLSLQSRTIIFIYMHTMR